MIYIFIDCISGSHGIWSIPHNNCITGNIFHHVTFNVTCISCVFILINAFVTITIERSHRTTFFSTICVITITESIILFDIIIRHFRNLILIVGNIEVDSHTPVFVLERNSVNTEFPSFICHFPGIHVANLITISITDSGRHLYLWL